MSLPTETMIQILRNCIDIGYELAVLDDGGDDLTDDTILRVLDMNSYGPMPSHLLGPDYVVLPLPVLAAAVWTVRQARREYLERKTQEEASETTAACQDPSCFCGVPQ